VGGCLQHIPRDYRTVNKHVFRGLYSLICKGAVSWFRKLDFDDWPMIQSDMVINVLRPIWNDNVCEQLVVIFGEEICRFRVCCGRFAPMQISVYFENLNWCDIESSTHHFATIFLKTSCFNPEIAVSHITGNVVSFCQRTVTAVCSWTASDGAPKTQNLFFISRRGKCLFVTEQTIRFTDKVCHNDQPTVKQTVAKHVH
jgi:hypothetical protein